MPAQTDSKKHDIHPDFIKYRMIKMPLNPLFLPVINALLTRMLNKMPVPDGLSESRQIIKGYKDAPIRMSVISPTRQDITPLPALVYFHGGAFAMQAAKHHKWLAFEYALNTPCKVFFVDYRLLPKATFPIGLEDCYNSYRWVCENYESLGIDQNKIAVGGDSAGGALAAGVCLLARERKIPMPCFQLLIYPVTDERQTTDSMNRFKDTPLWNSKLNAKMWKMYLKNGFSDRKGHASPAEADKLTDMPPAYIEVAEYDPLRDEGIAFAKALENGDTSVVLHETKRTIHGFEIARYNEIVLESVAKRVEQLRNAFYRNDNNCADSH